MAKLSLTEKLIELLAEYERREGEEFARRMDKIIGNERTRAAKIESHLNIRKPQRFCVDKKEGNDDGKA